MTGGLVNRKAVKPEKKTSAEGPMPVKSAHKDRIESHAMKFEKKAIDAELAGNYEAAAEAYQKAAEFEFDREQKSNFFLLCAECWMRARNSQKAHSACNRAIEAALIEDKDSVREKAVRIMAKGAEIIVANGDYGYAAVTYGHTSTLEQDEKKKMEYIMLCIENLTKAERYCDCAHQYELVAEREKDNEKKKEYFLLAGEYYAKGRNYRKTYDGYKKAINFADGEEKDKIKRNAVEIFLKGAREAVGDENRAYKALGYLFAAELEENNEKKKEYFILSAENSAEINDRISCAGSYHKAAELEEDREKKIKYLMLAGENYVAGDHGGALEIYQKAIELAEGEEKDKIRKTAIKTLVDRIEKYVEEKNYTFAAVSYHRVADLEENIENKIGYFLLFGENLINGKNYNEAGEAYLDAMELGEGEKRNKIREMALEILLSSAEKEAEQNNPWSAASAYRTATKFTDDKRKKIEYFGLSGDSYLKGKNYGECTELYSRAAELAHEIGDKEKVIELLKKVLAPSIEVNVRSETLGKLVAEYIKDDYAYLFVYNVKTNGNVPEINERIRELAGINKKDLEYLKETIRYLPTRVISEVNMVELLSSNPREFYALVRLEGIPFQELIEYYKNNPGEVENRLLKKTGFDSSNPLHVAVEYGRYLGKVRSMSPVVNDAKIFLTYEEFKEEIDKPPEKLELEEAELKYLSYEINKSAKVLKQLIEDFGGIVLVGNLRTGEYYGDLMVRKVKDERLFHSIARMPSSALHDKEYFLKGELLDKVTVKNITSVNAKPVVIVDATPSRAKIPDAFKGFMSWATGYNILLLKAKSVGREKIIEQVSDLTLTHTEVVDNIYDEVTNPQSSFYKRIWPWVKLNPERKKLVRINIVDMDDVYKYRIKRDYAYYMPPRKGIDEGSADEDIVPMVLLQPSVRVENIPAIIQERIGTSKHKKGYLDDNGVGRLMLRADKDGVSIVTNIVEVISEKISGS